jgi:hypothetical protein
VFRVSVKLTRIGPTGLQQQQQQHIPDASQVIRGAAIEKE